MFILFQIWQIQRRWRFIQGGSRETPLLETSSDGSKRSKICPACSDFMSDLKDLILDPKAGRELIYLILAFGVFMWGQTSYNYAFFWYNRNELSLSYFQVITHEFDMRNSKCYLKRNYMDKFTSIVNKLTYLL